MSKSKIGGEVTGLGDGALSPSQPADEDRSRVPDVLKTFHEVVDLRPTLFQVLVQAISVLRLDGRQGPRALISSKAIERVLAEDGRERDRHHVERMTFMLVVALLTLALFAGVIVVLYLVRDRPAVFDSILHWTTLAITHATAGTVGYQLAARGRKRRR